MELIFLKQNLITNAWVIVFISENSTENNQMTTYDFHSNYFNSEITAVIKVICKCVIFFSFYIFVNFKIDLNLYKPHTIFRRVKNVKISLSVNFDWLDSQIYINVKSTSLCRTEMSLSYFWLEKDFVYSLTYIL